MEDIEKECKDCHEKFVITVDDQLFYKNLNYDLPVRCKACRQKRRIIRGKEQK